MSHHKTGSSHKLVSASDGRSSIHNCRQIIYRLREYHDPRDIIPWDDVKYFIEQNCGLDPRTLIKYAEILVQLNYLEPLGKRVRNVTVKPTSSYGTRTYSRKGVWRKFRFGLKAPKAFQETLNPKYVPPRTPLPRVRERVEGQKSMRVLYGAEDKQNDHVEEAPMGASRIDREEREYRPHTHIVGTRVQPNQKNRELESFQGNKTANKLSGDGTRMQENGTPVQAYIIDYDIPKNISGRRTFYNRLSKLKQKYGYSGKSSLSVLKTIDRELAYKIYDLALTFDGEAHVWRAFLER